MMKKIDLRIAAGAVIVALVILGLSIYFTTSADNDNAALSREVPAPPAGSPTFSLPPSVHILGKDRSPKGAASALAGGAGSSLRRPSLAGGSAGAQ